MTLAIDQREPSMELMNISSGLENSNSSNASRGGNGKLVTREKLCIDDVEDTDLDTADCDLSYLFRK